MKRLGRFILALLRELADESAYQRHLAAHGRAHSTAEWRRFSEERQRARYAMREVLLKPGRYFDTETRPENPST